MAVNNLSVSGSFSFGGTITHHTKTITTDTTFTQSDIFDNDIIYINKASNGTYTLPQISTLIISANTSYILVFVNINSGGVATLTRSGSDTIEGATTLKLNKIFMKVVLVVSDQLASTWLIKG